MPQTAESASAETAKTTSPAASTQELQSKPSIRSFLLLLVPFCYFLARWALLEHYALPTPRADLYDSATMLPHFSEAQALRYVHHYSEEIGYRIVGTPEMDQTMDYTIDTIKQIQEQATNPNIEIEVSRQRGDGHHLFEFMGKKVWKKYLGIENIVVRISNGTQKGKDNAILLNAHLDSTLPSPGASDDAAAVAVMLESIRVLTQTPNLELNTALVFLFNGAEESLQDASHLFITQHEWRHTLRAVINLEACGTSGAEMLFQATSSAMLDIYSQVPRPFGSIIAPEIFGTGLILSDTDFRQFEQYGGLTGLDMALVKDSYKYHTRLDLVEYIEPGALQHFGDNVVAMLKAIGSSDPSKFIGLKKVRNTLYFTALGGKILVMVKASTASIAYAILFAASVAVAVSRIPSSCVSGYVACFVSVPFTMVSGVASANVAALVMTKVLARPLTYFRKEWWCVPLYGAPAILGMLVAQLLLSALISNRKLVGGKNGSVEHAMLVGQLIFLSGVALAGQLLGVLSSYIHAIGAASLLVTLLLNDFVLAPRNASTLRHVTLASYLIGQAVPIITGAEGLASFLDVIVPLTGRMGVDAPSDHIIASLVSGIAYLVVPTIPMAAHRFGRNVLTQAVVLMLFISGGIISIFAAPGMQTFDFLHPKRVLCLYMEDTNSNALSLHIAGLDPTPFEHLVEDLADKMELQERPVLSEIRDDIADWDIIYPVSQFLHSYKIPLPSLPSSYVSPFRDTFKVELLESRLNAVTRARSIKLAIHHPGIIWSVIAFDANVMRWNLPAAPEPGMIRHHVKEASAYNVSTWELDMELQLDDVQFQAALRQSQRRKGQRKKDPVAEAEDDRLGGLKIEFSGLDVKRMWHHRSNEHRENMEFVDRLDKAMPDWVDPMLLTAVSGVTIV